MIIIQYLKPKAIILLAITVNKNKALLNCKAIEGELDGEGAGEYELIGLVVDELSLSVLLTGVADMVELSLPVTEAEAVDAVSAEVFAALVEAFTDSDDFGAAANAGVAKTIAHTTKMAKVKRVKRILKLLFM